MSQFLKLQLISGILITQLVTVFLHTIPLQAYTNDACDKAKASCETACESEDHVAVCKDGCRYANWYCLNYNLSHKDKATYEGICQSNCGKLDQSHNRRGCDRGCWIYFDKLIPSK
jgi:hypothetical protein